MYPFPNELRGAFPWCLILCIQKGSLGPDVPAPRGAVHDVPRAEAYVVNAKIALTVRSRCLMENIAMAVAGEKVGLHLYTFPLSKYVCKSVMFCQLVLCQHPRRGTEHKSSNARPWPQRQVKSGGHQMYWYVVEVWPPDVIW